MLSILNLENVNIELAEVRSSKLGHGADTEKLSSQSFLKRIFSLLPQFCWEQDNGNWRLRARLS